jgi:hypothetical protein
MGRRDKALLDNVSNTINDRLSQRPQETSDEASTRLLENPREMIRQEIVAERSESTQQETAHLNEAMQTVGGMMESDSLYKDKDLGSEVVAEIKNMVQTGNVESGVPGAQAGKLMLADALSNVMRKRQSAKINPLENNKPGGGGDNLQAPAKATTKLKAPKLDPDTQKLADRFGYSPEQLVKVFGEKST